MEIIDNVNKTLKEDLTKEIHKGSKVSIAVACFSIYAFAELKKELKNVEELRFIFTSPTCILANSVDLGKTFDVLSAIKYYENKNK